MLESVLHERRAERDRLLAVGRGYAQGLPADLGVLAVVVFGSVARGDFNVWSDVDVLVIAEKLPDLSRGRSARLLADAPPRVAPIGWTLPELRRQLARNNAIACEAVELGVSLRGATLTDLLSSSQPEAIAR